jgi:hypothetical protein
MAPAMAQTAPQQPAEARAAGSETRPRADQLAPTYYVILNNPKELDDLILKIANPDLEVRQVEPIGRRPDGPVLTGRSATVPGVVEAVRLSGQIADDSAALKLELTILSNSDSKAWFPVRLDGQKQLIGAREAARDLDLQIDDGGPWEVELTGRGRHHVAIGLRVPLGTKSARKALSLAIPEAALTSLELDFSRHESDVTIGGNEVLDRIDLPDGKGVRVRAHLSPRPTLEVSWTDSGESPEQNSPMLSAQGEIAVEIDSEQMRTSSSWVIRCVRGMTRALEVHVSEEDEITEIRLDDQPAGPSSEAPPRATRVTIPLGDPMRPGASKRLVMKTRRPYSKAAGRRISFTGFPVTHTREQAGSIGVTQSSNLWVSPAATQGLRRIDITQLPAELRARPGTSLAFEFLDPSFRLELDVEAAPPLVRARSTTAFRIDSGHARSETTIELQWVRGPVFEIDLGIAPGLQLVSVGPVETVEGSTSTVMGTSSNGKGASSPSKVVKVRLTPFARDQNKVTLMLEGHQGIPQTGPVRLGLFTPVEATRVAAYYAFTADRSLSLELEDESGQFAHAREIPLQLQGLALERPPLPGEAGLPGLMLTSSANPVSVPIRIARHARSVSHETLLSAQVSTRSIDVIQKSTLTARYGALASVEIQVPAALSRRWELLERDIANLEDIGRDADGSERYRLHFGRPIFDKTTLRFRSRLPVEPHLDASGPRDLDVPRIAFLEVHPGPTSVELTMAPEVVFQASAPGWIRQGDETQAERSGQGPILVFADADGRRQSPFAFKAIACEPAALPPLLVPRLLIKTELGSDGSIRSRAWFWIETHGPALAFSLPDGARLLAARIDNRVADRVDRDPGGSGYRLRFPAESGARPALVELEYYALASAAGSRMRAPQVLDGGVVLESLWDVQFPGDQVIVGVPTGWTDENEWYWDGNLWRRRPWRSETSLNDWILGSSATTAAITDLQRSRADEAHRLLFSRAGPPTTLMISMAPRAGIVAVCSGATLLFGFLAIFSRVRFGTIWVVIATLGLAITVILPPSVVVLAVQSAFIGAALSLLGLLIQRQLDRRRSPGVPGWDTASSVAQVCADSSLNRTPGVGSDDSTAIRVRVPSTIDLVPSPTAGSPVETEPRGSTPPYRAVPESLSP